MKRVAIALAFCIGCFARPSHAELPSDEARASALFQDGANAYSKGNFRAAAKAFEAAFRLLPRGAAIYNAGIAWQELKERARAANAYTRALALGDLDAGQSADAKKRLAALEPELGKLSVSGSGGHVSAGPVDGEPTPLDVYLEPGSSHIRFERADGSVLEKDVKLRAGQSSSLDFDAAEPTPSHIDDRDVPEPSTSNTGRTIGFVSLGAGVLASGAAIYLGTRAIAARNDYDNSGNTDAGARDRASSLRLWTNVAWGTAIVAGGVGLTLVLTSHSSPSEPATALSFGPGSVTLSRRF